MPKPIDHAEQERLNRQLEDDLRAILDDDDSPEFDPPEGVPLSDAPNHTQATFLAKPKTTKRR